MALLEKQKLMPCRDLPCKPEGERLLPPADLRFYMLPHLHSEHSGDSRKTITNATLP